MQDDNDKKPKVTSFDKRTRLAAQRYLIGRQLDMDPQEERGVLRAWITSISQTMTVDELRTLLTNLYTHIKNNDLALEVLTQPSLIDVKTTRRLILSAKDLEEEE